MPSLKLLNLFGLVAVVIASPIQPIPDDIRVYRVGNAIPLAETTTPTEPPSTPAPDRQQDRASAIEAQSRGLLPQPVQLPIQQEQVLFDEGPTPGHVLANSPFTCNGLKDGHYADVSYECKYFHQCNFFYDTDGKLFIQQAVFQCGKGTKFNQTLRTCDYEANVRCNPQLVQQIIEYQLTAPSKYI